MRNKIIIILTTISCLWFASSAIAAPDATVNPDAVPVMATKAEPAKAEPAKADIAPSLPDAKSPETIEEGIDQAQTLIGAIKAKAWWLVAAASIFIVMLIMQLLGLFKKMGKRLTWIITGVLSLAAALFLAFDKTGFSWQSFMTFVTAGPTIAWLRGFVKKAVIGKAAEEKPTEGNP